MIAKIKTAYFVITAAAIILISCTDNPKKKTDALFEKISTTYSGINFKNKIHPNDTLNILKYEYLYNGGGVGIGDFNNDSLPDIFFTGNIEESKLYINNGNLSFEDITEKSHIKTKNKWCTGVSIIDINQDGLDDIYINVGGMGNKNIFPNLLYINNGDLTFTESADSYGLADSGESIQSIFFDYDLDGDLDMYLLTGGGFENSAIMVRPMKTNGTSRNTDRLYRNDFDTELGHPVFTNVSIDAGITVEGFGLGVAVIDANNDHWPDIYISNDYLSKDLLYINQKNGSFKEEASRYFGHVSHFSMGNDIADINNDGFLDIITLDMLPEDVKRRKLMSGANSYDMFHRAIQYGYDHQYMRNMLQFNNGNGTFSEIGQLAGIDKTDWSWSPLIADFDNDGYNDLFVTNGFGKDITDLDFVKFRENGDAFANYEDLTKAVIDCLYHRPEIKVANYAYRNNGDLSFEKVSSKWGFTEKSLSNGAAYADLDVDGDLDLVISNINAPASIYKNTLREKRTNSSNYLEIRLEGTKNNKKGIGALVSVFSNENQQIRYNQPVRGFLSTVDSKLHFGLQNTTTIDSIQVDWPDGKVSLLKNIASNKLLSISHKDALDPKKYLEKSESIEFFIKDSTIRFSHRDREYNDFANQPLLVHGFSNQGPGMAVGDLNNDGLEDLFIGGSYGYTSTVFYQTSNGEFIKNELPKTELYEDQGALIFDANNDGWLDLYVVSGGSERYEEHEAYQDRLYYNIKGNLELGKLPSMQSSTSTVTGGDFDNDGDIDLFIGGRVIPGKFPLPPRSYILENNSGEFRDVTNEVCPFLMSAGMVTSAIWTDYDNDLFLDLVIVGEFMPITILKGSGTKLENITSLSNLENSSGMWNSIQSGDFDNDGDIDFIAGNIGVNSYLNSNMSKALRLDFADFDSNGSVDPIFSKFEESNYYPIASLDELTAQLPVIKKKILHYSTFANASTTDILRLFNEKPSTLYANELRSCYIENLGQNTFKLSPLPLEAQIAPIYGCLVKDINQDGLLDILTIGNNYNTEVNGGRHDASIGNCYLNKGKGKFEPLNHKISGFSVLGNSKSLVELNTPKKTLILIGNNNADLSAFSLSGTNQILVSPNKNEISAKILFNNGKTRKKEFTLGAGYLSQSSNKFKVTQTVRSITFYNPLGVETRTLDINILRSN